VTKKPMTKAQLVEALAEKTGSDKKSVNGLLDALSEVVTDEVCAGGAVMLPGLGRFVCRDRPKRMVRNPATGEKIEKPADRTARVTIAKALKDAINS